MTNDPRGSNWSKWDLHVHTPDSIVQYYPGQKKDAWEAFLKDIESLPDEYKVVGINDYIFLDGYRRVLEERGKGRMANIATIFPVIELRIDMFGGSGDKLKRINYHVLFSDEVDPDTIQSQFINGLKKSYYLDGKTKSWDSLPTMDSLGRLGKIIFDGTPEPKRTQFPSSMKELGFNNLNFNLETIRDLLRNPDFEGNHLTALGRNEWASFPWNDQFIADKKSLVQHVDFILGASKTVAEYDRCKLTLKSQDVNDKLIQASDAHALSDSDKPNKIGNSLTWIKADPTFQGLCQALKRFDDRVFVGEVPAKSASVQENPNKYIQNVSVAKTAVKFEETWFDSVTVPFNHGLVAIIGNKGSAKSALTDLVGLLGNSYCEELDYSFLHKDKFHAKPEMKSKHFLATLLWEDAKKIAKQMDGKSDSTEPELVKYIPQKFFEKICNEIAKGNFAQFDSELESVIFSHVKFENRLGKSSLRELIKHKTEEISAATVQLAADLSKINRCIVDIEDRLSPENRQTIEKKLSAKKAELVVHRAQKPGEVADPATLGNDAITSSTSQIKTKGLKVRQLEIDIAEQRSKLAEVVFEESNLEKAKNKIQLLRSQFAAMRAEFESLSLAGLAFDDVAKLTIKEKPLNDLGDEISTRKTSTEKQLDIKSEASLFGKKAKLETEITALQATLDEPNRLYQSYLKDLKKWEKKEAAILSAKVDDSIGFYEGQLRELDKLPATRKELEADRIALSENIFEQIRKEVQEYKSLYAVVQDFIQNHALANEFNLEFDVSIVNDAFHQNFIDLIDQGAAGTFYGKAAGKDQLEKIIEKYDFNSCEGVVRFAEEILDCLRNDKRNTTGAPNPIASQLKSGKSVLSLYDFILGLKYLRPHFVLKMLGKEMNQLSPGEKGTLLLVFYLLIDKGDVPLIIDQPEENLDNETIVKLLVPAIEEAKTRRQVIIVTHNPNLAVVCDAEQVIRAHIHKTDKNRVEYITGSIENPKMNEHLVDVLEGTSRAFKIRSGTYNLH